METKKLRGLIEHYDLRYKRLLKAREKNYEAGYMGSVDRLDARLNEIENFLKLLKESFAAEH